MGRAFVDNVELWLSGAGIVVILSVPQLMHVTGDQAWRVAAVVATVVGVLHGLMFWLIRRRQRLVRRQVVAELRRMLRDRINNDLTSISLALSDVRSPDAAHAMADLHDAIQRISASVSSLSDESLQSWRRRYESSSAIAPETERP